MKKRTDYLYEDVGELYLRQRKIDDLIREAEDALKRTESLEKATFVIGEIAALNDHRNSKHIKIVESIIEVKKALENHQYYDSILDEIEYVEGYKNGLNALLKLDRELFDASPNFVLFLYTTTEALRNKYDLAFSAFPKMGVYTSGESIRYFVTMSADEICGEIVKLDRNTMNAVCVVYQEGSRPSKEIMQQLAFEKNDNVFLVCDKEEIQVSSIVRKIIRATTV